MELPVVLQLRELRLALAFGAGLGLLYELLRPFRRGPRSAALADLLFCLLLLAGLLLFALYAGRGRLRLFVPAAMALSGGLWLRFVTPVSRRMQNAVGRRLFRSKKSEKNLRKQ